MANYTIWDINELLPGEPWTSAKAIAAFENLDAAFEGATGAPRLQTAALFGPEAGSAHIINNLQLGTISTINTAYPSGQLQRLASAEQHVGVLCLASGSIRCSGQHRQAGVGARTSLMRVLRNGTQIVEWETTSTSFQSRQVDVSVSSGDIVVFQQRINNSDTPSEWRNLQILSANPNLTVL